MWSYSGDGTMVLIESCLWLLGSMFIRNCGKRNPNKTGRAMWKKGENSGSASFKNICVIRCAALTWDGNANQTDASPVQIHDLF